MANNQNLLSKLPKVDKILSEQRIINLDVPRNLLMDAIRETLDDYRENIKSGKLNEIDYEQIINAIVTLTYNKNKNHLKRVINATGTILHTNLGRAVLSKSAIEAVVEVASKFNNLEFDLNMGERGSRYSHVEKIICKITGAEAAMVVNNNAAAVMLVLSTLSKGKEAIVSRGQLVEIGGSFRVPAVMEQSGAKLIEVGTTNKTHLFDYENAITENTGIILKVHQSNFKVLGFTKEVALEELVELGQKYNIPVVEDIGSGVLIDFSKYSLSYEPTVQESIKKGADVVTFSGDKLLGGPQAGIIVGKKKYIDMMKKNQLTRALRIDKMTLAALEATFKLYIDEEKAIKEIPSLNMITMDISTVQKKAKKLQRLLKNKLKLKAKINIQSDVSQFGGGAMPLETIPTYVVSIKPNDKKIEEVEKCLRMQDIPIIVRVYKEQILLDLRTIFEDEYEIIVNSFDKIL
ncbi:L-seryl-tRNA(Sec) selenium transferase [Caloramator mitchellensis]|uniref:L-seryl-tRNA(Sec) selenium transferase n=1 Tax=Caloramator mitchellensis TaxID=908809 RepID=A0A0R3JZI7_CALMK|nr:L-seryl-tRNA(Sec) selenium transferase [Caloramator mitchellensis]KRQ86005.1 L-seryl-tRNA(Sec) selenium transferase [Caloramator mitchellensis]